MDYRFCVQILCSDFLFRFWITDFGLQILDLDFVLEKDLDFVFRFFIQILCSDKKVNQLIKCAGTPNSYTTKEALSENELILARTGLFHLAQGNKQKMWICYRHRHTLGKFWRSTKVTCQYPGHAGVGKRIQGRDVITLHMSQDIQKLFGVIIPVGSGSLQ